jgi:hypothetical protein
MTSLWGTKKTDDNADDVLHVNGNENGEAADMARTSDERPRSSRASREPNERDRLLPRNPGPPHRDGYLDPDDPAVGVIQLDAE